MKSISGEKTSMKDKKTPKKVFVCAGMKFAKNDKINQEAALLGEILAKNNVEYWQGGVATGLMGETLKTFFGMSKNITCVIPELYYEDDVALLREKYGDELKIVKVKSELDRLKYIKECDRVIVLPGGTGTLEELLFCNEILRSGEDNSPLEIINIDGFYDGFIQLVTEGVNQGLIGKDAINFVVVNSVTKLKF